MAYAATTKVPVSQSKNEIETLCTKRGADAFGIMSDRGAVQIAFRLDDRNILFRFAPPDHPQKQRAAWRAVLLTIKAKFESIDLGIETFEEAFLAHIVMPNGQTVGETAIPAIASSYRGESNVPLLPRR